MDASNGYSGLISSKIDLFVHLSVHGIRKSFLQHHSSKESIFFRSACFKVQLSQPYVVIGKTIVLIIRIFVSMLISLLLISLSRFVIAFLPRSSLLLISTMKSPSLFTFGLRKIKSLTISTCPLSMLNSSMGPFVMTNVIFMFSLKPAAALAKFTLVRRHFRSLTFSARSVVSSAYRRLFIF